MNFANKTDTECKAYNDAVRYAVTRAARDNIEVWVCALDHAYFVLDVKATIPEGAKKICIAQRWDDNTVQLRFNGAHSEFVKI
jgi:hypothetical protein